MSKRFTLMKCQTLKSVPKHLRKAKSFYSQAEKFVVPESSDMTEEKLKKLEQSFHNSSDIKVSQLQNRYNKSNSVQRKRGCDTIIPEWIKSRKDFQQFCYTQTVENLFAVPKIILRQQKNMLEDQKTKLWIQQIITGLPEELYKKLCQILQTRVFENDDIFDVDHNISILYEGKINRISKEFGFTLNGTNIKIGDFLNDEYMYQVKQDAIIVDIPKIELMQILDDYKHLQLEYFVQQMKTDSAFSLMKINSLQKIIKKGSLNLILRNYPSNQRISNSEYLNILLVGKLQLNLRKQISKINKWPISQKKWETKVYYQYQDKTLELEPVSCFGLTDDQYTMSTKDSCVLLQIRKSHLEEKIMTSEQISDLKQSIDIFKTESKKQLRERMRRRFDTELVEQKIRMKQLMLTLLKN